MYIFIMEGGDPMVSATCTDEDMASCDDGIIDVIDISGDVPLQYYNGWHELESADDD